MVIDIVQNLATMPNVYVVKVITVLKIQSRLIVWVRLLYKIANLTNLVSFIDFEIPMVSINTEPPYTHWNAIFLKRRYR